MVLLSADGPDADADATDADADADTSAPIITEHPLALSEDPHAAALPILERLAPRVLTASVRGTACVHEGVAYTWGFGVPRAAPMKSLVLGVTVREVACGVCHTLVLDTGGGVWSFGDASEGKLGHGDDTSLAEPRRVVACGLDAEVVTAVAVSHSHSLVLTAQGAVLSWGSGLSGRHGLTDDGKEQLADQWRPKQVEALSEVVVIDICCGDAHSLALTNHGTLLAWGVGSDGRLGVGPQPKKLTGRECSRTPWPCAVPPGVSFRFASAGAAHSLAVSRDGAVYSFGCGGGGRLGHGEDEQGVLPDCWLPTKIAALNGRPAHRVAAGGEHSLVLTADGKVYTFGSPANGRLGLGDARALSSPATMEGYVGTLVESTFPSRATDREGRLHVPMPYVDGVVNEEVRQLFAIGQQRRGGRAKALAAALAAGSSSAPAAHAAAAAAPPPAVLHLPSVPTPRIGAAAGDRRSGMAVRQLTGGFTRPVGDPLAPPPVVEIVAGGSHSMLRLATGKLWAWGSNRDGQLGLPYSVIDDDDPNLDWSTPVKVDGPPAGPSR